MDVFLSAPPTALDGVVALGCGIVDDGVLGIGAGALEDGIIGVDGPGIDMLSILYIRDLI